MLTDSSPDYYEAIKTHALENYKEECCGLILEDYSVIKLENIARSIGLDPRNNFAFEQSKLTEYPNITCIYHSHVNGNDRFTPSDARLCLSTQIPLLLYSLPYGQIKKIDPSGNTPLLKREFCYGVYDCYTLLKDYYKQNLGIHLSGHNRTEPIINGEFDWEQEGWNELELKLLAEGFKIISRSEFGMVGDVVGYGKTKVNHISILHDPVAMTVYSQDIRTSKEEYYHSASIKNVRRYYRWRA